MRRSRVSTAALLALFIIGITRAEMSVQAATPSLWDLSFLDGSACSICTDCSGLHATVEGSQSEGLHGTPLQCIYAGTCEQHHGPCGVGLAPGQKGKRCWPRYWLLPPRGQRSDSYVSSRITLI
jgi:hypothetical protein